MNEETMTPICTISNTIDLSDFNPETDDVYKYIEKHHIKITGL